MSGYLDSHLSHNSQETAFLVTLENPNDEYFEDATDDFDSIIVLIMMSLQIHY